MVYAGAFWPVTTPGRCPRLAEKRNVYWDATSVRLINNQPMTLAEEDWPAGRKPRGHRGRQSRTGLIFPTARVCWSGLSQQTPYLNWIAIYGWRSSLIAPEVWLTTLSR